MDYGWNLGDWEARAAGKPQKCDLLEVYSDNDKKRLVSDHQGNWSILASVEDSTGKKDRLRYWCRCI